ncbi:MAG: hypothetical protein V5A16_05600 [Haloplanus sp.]
MTRFRSRLTHTTLAVLLVVALVAGAAAPAAATHNDDSDDNSAFDALFGGEDDEGGLATAASVANGVRGFVEGGVQRTRWKLPLFAPETSSAAESANATMAEFNDHSADYVAYANARNVSGGEVVAITFEQNGETETIYLVANYNHSSDEYESAEMVADTDRSVDETVTLDDMAAENAPDELDRFHSEFAEPNEDVTPRYTGEMASKYRSDVSSSLLPGGSD